ncbi:transglutaminase family protein [Extensimonas sp. H3M7-6]|uniref:transglutaminase family protein n=1 Tax=Extensimonas soli TaxID=3031322 RepID=UPI0023DB719D|nr:transglutaminase family protein [Extensimonas sp. H3M7-6]MDF1480507.1 transglutaminase family protein [Extensimonas sp. H3M7-6]
MLLRILHRTCYRYQGPVDHAQHMLHLSPVDTAVQQVHAHTLRVTPEPAAQSQARDTFGNLRSFFTLQAPHESLCVEADSLVQTQPPAALPIAAAAATSATAATAVATAGASTAAAPSVCAAAAKALSLVPASAATDAATTDAPSTDAPTAPAWHAPWQATWEAVREHYRYRAGAPYDAASEFLFASPHVPRDDAFAAFARPAFAPGTPLLAAAQALMERIHRELRYTPASTQVNTPALQALAQRKGVCQDFAHIMLGCLRSLGLPARYVSGYLLTRPPFGKPRLIGADASHAWVSVYVPWLAATEESATPPHDTAPTSALLHTQAQQAGGSWFDFDPTNRRSGWGSPGEDYVTLAVGRDFSDVSPMRGVIQGGGAHELEVGVTVAPPDELQALLARREGTAGAKDAKAQPPR